MRKPKEALLLKVITNEYGTKLIIEQRYQYLKKLVESGATAIVKMQIINEQGEIINEFKRL